MTKAIDLINQALLSLGVKRSGESLASHEVQDMLDVLRQMLDGWSNEHLLIPAEITESLPLTTGQHIYTYGPGGDLDTVRPQKILDCFLRDRSGYDYPVDIIYRERYNDEPDKGQPSRPYQLYWNSTSPQLTLFFDNSPDIAYTAFFTVLKPFISPEDINEEIAFPPGYDRAIRYNLAAEASSMFGANIPPTVAAIAEESIRRLKVQNARIPVLKTEISDNRQYNIYTDY